MDRELVLTWKNPESHEWIPVGRLAFCTDKYVFKYTYGAKKAEEEGYFVPFGKMTDLNKLYESTEIFPIFKNRLLQKSRPEYADYLDWLNLTQENYSPIDELARSGGIRVTDNLQLFPIPKEDNGRYEVTFFSHGIRYLPPTYIERIGHLNQGNKLFLMKDVQNNFDVFALVLRTGDPPEIVGYVPRFFARDFNILIDKNGPKKVSTIVEKVNLNAPHQFKLMCRLTSDWPIDFEPFSEDSFKELC